MRRALAAGLDAVSAALLSYLGFRLGDAAAACKDPGSCPLLAPLIVFCVLAAVLLYFGAGYLLWRSTPGERLLRQLPGDS